MKLLTQSIINQLAKNGEVAEQDPSFDPSPVVKLFTPDAGATWLLAWTDPQDPDIAFGHGLLLHMIDTVGILHVNQLVFSGDH